MGDLTVETTGVDDLENISDEDFAKLTDVPGAAQTEETVEETTVETSSSTPESNPPEDSTTTEEKQSEETSSTEVPSESTETTSETPADTTTVPVTVDYEAEYKKILAPFKANGVDLQIRNAEDAIQLMQMGAGYHKKMATLKPARKAVKLLEKHNLLDPEKLNYLIDLADKKPEAISRLLKDARLDPLDVNLNDEKPYTPTPRTVTDIELELDNVLEDIQHTPTYNKTLTVLTQDWDETSQKAVATTPHVIKLINGHMQDGTFDKVMGAVNYERSLGRLQGVSDFEAYKAVGDVLYKQGLITVPNQSVPVTPQPISTPAVSQPNQSTVQETARQKSKQAARPTKASGPTGTQAMSLAALSDMSDADFEKLSLKDLQIS